MGNRTYKIGNVINLYGCDHKIVKVGEVLGIPIVTAISMTSFIRWADAKPVQDVFNITESEMKDIVDFREFTFVSDTHNNSCAIGVGTKAE